MYYGHSIICSITEIPVSICINDYFHSSLPEILINLTESSQCSFNFRICYPSSRKVIHIVIFNLFICIQPLRYGFKKDTIETYMFLF